MIQNRSNYMRRYLFLLFFVASCGKSGSSYNGAIPMSPSSLNATLASSTKINLSWTDNSTDEEGFMIERKSGSGSYGSIGSTSSNLTTFIDGNISTNSTYTYRVYSYNSAGNSYTYTNEVTISTSDTISNQLKNGLVAWYPFTGNANDSSGYGNNGTVYGATLTSDRFGNNNSAYNFNGSSYITLTNLPTSGSQNFSIAGWIKTNSSSTRNGIICWGQDSPNASVYLFINNSGQLEFDLAYNAGPNSPINVINNAWHFVCVTSTSGLIQLYLDGSPTGSAISMSPNITGGNKSIGQNITNTGVNNFIGTIDDIRIWNRAITQSEITYLATH